MNDGMNKVLLLGNLGSTPELRFTASGTAVLNFRLATSETFVDRNKEPQSRTDWHNIVVWGARAQGLSKVLSKGSAVLIEGGLRTSSFEKDGSKRYKTEIHAKDIHFVGRRSPSEGAGPGGAEPVDETLEQGEVPPSDVRPTPLAGRRAPPVREQLDELPY